ncbi:MAG TPA: (2Fe-2S)-binding protein [Methylomirabilota bacterium]|nr:(2Fe-2S)-binding protein [Methylomirabilota bacterium]
MDAGEAIDITVTVNGVACRRRVDARQSLVDFLREDLELTGSHVGCEHGVCGACTVRVDGVLARGCLMLAAQCDGSAVETIEGVAASGTIADLQAAFAVANALQCGYCTPAMLLTADALLREDPGLGADEIRRGLSGNYCRCTGYHAIVEAVLATARSRREARGG